MTTSGVAPPPVCAHVFVATTPACSSTAPIAWRVCPPPHATWVFSMVCAWPAAWARNAPSTASTASSRSTVATTSPSRSQTTSLIGVDSVAREVAVGGRFELVWPRDGECCAGLSSVLLERATQGVMRRVDRLTVRGACRKAREHFALGRRELAAPLLHAHGWERRVHLHEQLIEERADEMRRLEAEEPVLAFEDHGEHAGVPEELLDEHRHALGGRAWLFGSGEERIEAVPIEHHGAMAEHRRGDSRRGFRHDVDPQAFGRDGIERPRCERKGASRSEEHTSE